MLLMHSVVRWMCLYQCCKEPRAKSQAWMVLAMQRKLLLHSV